MDCCRSTLEETATYAACIHLLITSLDDEQLDDELIQACDSSHERCRSLGARAKHRQSKVLSGNEACLRSSLANRLIEITRLCRTPGRHAGLLRMPWRATGHTVLMSVNMTTNKISFANRSIAFAALPLPLAHVRRARLRLRVWPAAPPCVPSATDAKAAKLQHSCSAWSSHALHICCANLQHCAACICVLGNLRTSATLL